MYCILYTKELFDELVTCYYSDPLPVKTTATVLNMICRSLTIEKFRMYSLSNFTTSSKSVMSDLPEICQSPVMPGLMDRRLA